MLTKGFFALVQAGTAEAKNKIAKKIIFFIIFFYEKFRSQLYTKLFVGVKPLNIFYGVFRRRRIFAFGSVD